MKMRPAIILLNQIRRGVVQRSFASGQVIHNKPSTPSSPTNESKLLNVVGLSEACLTTHEPVGPGAAKDAEYKVPEYFNYNKNSYFEAEVEMAKYRCPQPSALK